MESSKYTSSIYSSITSKNYIVHYLQNREKLPIELRNFYDGFIVNFFDNYDVHDVPLSISSISPIIELYMVNILNKGNNVHDFPEESEWLEKIGKNIANEELDSRLDDHCMWTNLQKILTHDSIDILPHADGIVNEEYRLMKSNWAFDKSYIDSLDTTNNIINIGGLHNAVKYL